MPHFYAKELHLPPLPFEEEGFKFCYEAKSLKDPRVGLMRVQHKLHDFCVLKIQQKEGVLLKGEKSTRPIPVGILQRALKILSQCAKDWRGNLALSHCPSEAYLIDWAHFNFERFHLEIGFGSGRFLLQKARANPKEIYIGLEVHTPSIEQVLRQIELLGLTNLYIARADARTLLEVLPPCCVGLDIHFPVPWPKHPNRRIFTLHTLKNMFSVLYPNGEIWLRTDSLEYFKDSLELALNLPTCLATIAKNAPQEVVSKYEARWVRQAKDIYDLRLKNLATSAHPKLPLLLLSSPKIEDKGLAASYLWQAKPQMGEDYFLNIQDVLEYKGLWLLPVSLGDVRSPLNKIVIWDRKAGSLEYVGGVPFNTRAQRHAHEALCALLGQEVCFG
ncbi:tRNA (guanosine(46)-N7)-methyltransferase TrmB [Helicobacter ailurogastricus]|uniref:tRNA (guanosine(46)-N7)-methyltransferase TrmB n=1 Tax=Helicobacter ailurogastricus TaxID=1578720 RepID=UPI00244D90F2|nr:tRNA (guanosine(46)-N7)-methyltransferase TrmB [Helicobacter ailurogastricus]GMB91996.1 tRNA (guanine-N(7)-)-methyltransferase TrmB [Helicobacter ailurogastricus]